MHRFSLIPLFVLWPAAATATPLDDAAKLCRQHKATGYVQSFKMNPGDDAKFAIKRTCTRIKSACVGLLAIDGTATPAAQCKALGAPALKPSAHPARTATASPTRPCAPHWAKLAPHWQQARWNICIKACEAGARAGQTLPELKRALGVRQRRSHFTIACDAAWRQSTPPSTKEAQKQCEPRRKVLAYAKTMEGRYVSKKGRRPILPRDGIPRAYKDSPLAKRRVHFATHRELMKRVIACPETSQRAKEGAKMLLPEIAQEIKTLEAAIAKAKADALAKYKTMQAKKAALAPKARKLVACKKCDDEKLWRVYGVADAICGAVVSKLLARAELRKLKRYGRKHGVVDLAQLKDQSDQIRDADETIRVNQREFKKLTRRRFPQSRCRRVNMLSEEMRRAGLK